MKTAALWKPLEDKKIRCELCSHFCVIEPSRTGICKVRRNDNGVLVTLAYGNIISSHADPVEKKPLFHFYPGSFTWSIASPGCNFRCAFCQNFEISQVHAHRAYPAKDIVTPDMVVAEAIAAGCSSISYTYTEPTVFLEFALDVAREAKQNGLKNIFVTNGFMSRQAFDLCAGLLDAANVDVKGNDEFYLKLCGGRLAPVLDSIRFLRDNGIWVEATTLVIPGENDGSAFDEIIRSIRTISPEIPWHLSRFFPMYRMQNIPVTPAETILRLRDKARKAGFRYVYTGNMPEKGGENTLCPKCSALLVKRSGYSIEEKDIHGSTCGKCGFEIAGRFDG